MLVLLHIRILEGRICIGKQASHVYSDITYASDLTAGLEEW